MMIIGLSQKLSLATDNRPPDHLSKAHSAANVTLSVKQRTPAGWNSSSSQNPPVHFGRMLYWRYQNFRIEPRLLR